MTTEKRQSVALSPWQWISLIAVVAGAAVGNIQQMWALDNRWQERIQGVKNEIQTDIKAVEEKIPPDWFRAMVEKNQEQIEKLDDRLDKIENSKKN